MRIFKYRKTESHTQENTDEKIILSVQKYRQDSGTRDRSVSILRTDKGKPYIPDSDIFVSVSHTDDMILVGVSDKDFGVDVERADRKIPLSEKLAERFFSEKEKQKLKAASEAEKNIVFLEIWVKKEAYLKLFGEGISKLSFFDTEEPAANISFQRIQVGKEYIAYICEKL